MPSGGRRKPPSFIHHERFRVVVYQFVVFGGIAWLAYFLLLNTAENLAARGMQTGYGFLFVSAGFDLDFKLIEYEPGVGTYGRIFVVGVLNTLFVSFFAIVFSTLLAFAVGIMRLSANWLVARIALVYVEGIRNTPVLVQIVFWHVSVFAVLPRVKDSVDVLDLGLVHYNNRGFYLPSPIAGELLWLTAAASAVAIAAVVVLRRWARRRQDLSGRQFPIIRVSLGILLALPVAVFLVTGAPLDWELPRLERFNFQGGVRLPPAFLTLFIALTIYYSAQKAEAVRAGIQSVPRGQLEAAHSLGLSWGATMRRVLVPQAMRAIIPPLLNGWVSLVRASSLGIAIGYAELVGLFMRTSLNQSGYAIEIVAMTMGFYMIVSLAMAGVLNLYNRLARIEEG